MCESLLMGLRGRVRGDAVFYQIYKREFLLLMYSVQRHDVQSMYGVAINVMWKGTNDEISFYFLSINGSGRISSAQQHLERVGKGGCPQTYLRVCKFYVFPRAHTRVICSHGYICFFLLLVFLLSSIWVKIFRR